MKTQMGISLSEVLISLFLSSFIMTISMQFYLNSKHQYLEAEKILTANFDLQWVSDLLSDSIRKAGFTPCLGIDQLHLKDKRAEDQVIHNLKIETHPRQLIQVNRMNEIFFKVLSKQSATEIVIPYTRMLHKNRPLLIADCEHAEVNSISSLKHDAKNTFITLDTPLQFSYATPTYVGEFLEEKWFIKKNIEGEPALHYQLGQTEEITSLINSLKIYRRKVHEKSFIEVVMGLLEEKTHKIRVLVRGT